MNQIKCVCIDIDGTLTDPYFFIPILNEITGKNLTKDDYTSINWLDTYGPDYSEMYKTFDDEYSYVYKTSTIVEGAKNVIENLKARGIEIYYVTARSKSIHDITAQWIADQGLDPNRVHSLGGNHGKVEAAKELGCDVFIEDDPNNAKNLAEAGYKVILMDTNYNKGVSGNNITRVNGWDQVKDIIIN